MSTIPDIPGTVHEDAPVSRNLYGYRSFVNSQRGLVAANAAAYINKRTARRNKFSDSTLKKVLKIATFVPAHPTRYTPGDFQVEKMKYFTVHRPGKTRAACTLINTVREFSIENRQASTHFVIGVNGEIIQMVDLQDVAYSVGGSTMPDGKKNGNYTSVGVELEGAVGERFTFAQYTALAKIISILNDISGFLPNKNLTSAIYIVESRKKIVGHSEILPDMKTDPGANFNYSLLEYLIQKMPVTTSAEWYHPPVDALASLDGALQQIYQQAANPGSATEAALVNMTTGNALANARQLYLQYGGRENMAAWAAVTAQQDAQIMGDNLDSQVQQMVRLASQIAPMPASSVSATLDFDSGLYSDEG